MAAMLKTVRRALADTLDVGLQGRGRVLAYQPRDVQIPTTGVLVYVAPDPSNYVEPWLSFDPQQWSHVRYVVTVCVPDDDAARALDLLDDLIDPTLGAANVFTSVYATPGLGLTAFHVDAQPELQPIQGPSRMSTADGNVTFWQVQFPVRVVVQTPTA